jgi:16S rRNA A1518/A1519 N6-dimethyltransferase RsmA/KsgA/DIM1 with predicted DNA glycosylase/AP lyase activity
VVELGPGTGSVTAAIEHRLAGRGRHVAVEIDPGLARYVRAQHAGCFGCSPSTKFLRLMPWSAGYRGH